MYRRDNIDVYIPVSVDYRAEITHLKELEAWLMQNNIKYSLIYEPLWSSYPRAINMRNEDATMFKLRFGL